MTRWWAGNALLTVGLLWVAIHRALLGLFPLSWGGPNIGGGFTVLLAYAAIVAGLTLVLTVLSDHRRARMADPIRRRLPRAPAVLAVVTALAAVAMVVAPPGPGGSGVVGRVGVTVDATGDPVLLLILCRRSVDEVILSGPNRGAEPNVRLATLTSPAPVSTTTELPLANLPAGWTGGPVDLPLDERPADLVIASARGDQSLLTQVAFTRDDLAALEPGRMLVGPDRTLAVDEAPTLCP